MKKEADTAGQARVVEAVTSAAEPIVAELGLELVEVQFRPEQVGWVLRLIIDRDSGVTLDDCTAVSRELSALLDVEDIVDGPAYHLEVSSPGLDRPLRTVRDYVRCKGRKIKVTTREPIARHGSTVVGVVDAVDDDGVVLVVEVKKEQERLPIAFALIAKAKPVIEF